VKPQIGEAIWGSGFTVPKGYSEQKLASRKLIDVWRIDLATRIRVFLREGGLSFGIKIPSQWDPSPNATNTNTACIS